MFECIEGTNSLPAYIQSFNFSYAVTDLPLLDADSYYNLLLVIIIYCTQFLSCLKLSYGCALRFVQVLEIEAIFSDLF